MLSTETADRRALVAATDPCGVPNPRLVTAAMRAFALGVLDLRIDATGGAVAALCAEVTRRAPGRFGVRVTGRRADHPEGPEGWDLPAAVDTVIVADPSLARADLWGDRRVL